MMLLTITLSLTTVVSQDATSTEPVLRQLARLGEPVQQLALSPDGKILIAAAQGEMHAISMKKEERLWQATLPDAPVAALDVGDELVAFHHGIAAASFFMVEDGVPGTGIGGLTAGQASRCLVIDPKDRWIWVGASGGALTRLVPDNVNSWSNRQMSNGNVTALALDGKGKTLVVGGEDGTIRFVGAQSANRDEKKIIEAHGESVSTLTVDEKGSWIASASTAGDLRLWKLSNAKPAGVLVEDGSPVVRAAFGPKAKLLASGHADGEVRIWDRAKGELRATLPADKGKVTGLVFVDKGNSLALSRADSVDVTLWDLDGI